MFKFLLLCIITSFFVSCEQNVEYPISHVLKIDARNESGENICENLLNEPTEKYKSYDVSNSLYKHRAVGEDLSKISPLTIQVDNVGNATIFNRFSRFERVIPKIEYYLTCPTIFGDKKEHAIVSYWEIKNKYDDHAACYKVTVDGEEVAIVEYPEHEYAITIVSQSLSEVKK